MAGNSYALSRAELDADGWVPLRRTAAVVEALRQIGAQPRTAPQAAVVALELSGRAVVARNPRAMVARALAVLAAEAEETPHIGRIGLASPDGRFQDHAARGSQR